MTEPDLHTNISGILKIDLIFLLLPFSIFFGLLILESQLGGFSFRVCHNHLKQSQKNRKNPTSPRDNTCQSLGLIFPCNKVLMVDPVQLRNRLDYRQLNPCKKRQKIDCNQHLPGNSAGNLFGMVSSRDPLKGCK